MSETKQPRLHALDNLRGLMMWLGIVIHASVIYTVMLKGVPWHDTDTTPLADVLIIVIHSFRMPVFFILAGFFAAMLLQSRGAEGMAQNRFKRLLIPFAVFYVPLLVLQNLFANLFVHRMARGTWGIDLSLNTVPGIDMLNLPSQAAWLNTMHLWFIWILMGISFATALVYRPLSRMPFVAKIGAIVASITASWFGFVLLAAPLVMFGLGYDSGMVEPRQSFLPPLAEWANYALFFAVGLSVFHHQARLFDTLQRRWIWNAAGGFVCMAIAVGLVVTQQPRLWSSFAACCVTWLWSLALIGMSLRHMSKTSPVLGYLADSSYFVYLIHMFLTIAFGLLLFKVNLPGPLKLLIVIVATTCFALLAYQLFVRHTAVGELLNGKRHPRKAAPAPAFTNTVSAA